MVKTSRRMTGTLLTSLALATAGLLAPAPAQAIDMRCRNAVAAYCSANWQSAGYWDYMECYDIWYNSACLYPNPGDPNWPYLPSGNRS